MHGAALYGDGSGIRSFCFDCGVAPGAGCVTSEENVPIILLEENLTQPAQPIIDDH
jgi:hypothetical protein